jgi:hypothetical protein
VDHGFIADALDIEPWPCGAEGAQTNGDAKDPINLGAYRHQFGHCVEGSQRQTRPRCLISTGATGQAHGGYAT